MVPAYFGAYSAAVTHRDRENRVDGTFIATNILNSGFLSRKQYGGRNRRVYEGISTINCGLLRACTDCIERYFKNKDGELSVLGEIFTVHYTDMEEFFCASPEHKVLSIRQNRCLKR